MSALPSMISEIKSVSTNAMAETKVRGWLSNADAQMNFDRRGSGTMNCSLMAEWSATRFNMGLSGEDWGAVIAKKAIATVAIDKKELPFTTGGADLFYLSNSGSGGAHELIVIRDGTDYALFHAWDGRFELFPQLNPEGKDFNIYGNGDAGKTRIVTFLTSGQTLVPQAVMPTAWAVRPVKVS